MDIIIDDKDFKRKLDEAECKGVQRARNTLVYVHQHLAEIETDPAKKSWHEKEAERLADDNQWNTVTEYA